MHTPFVFFTIPITRLVIYHLIFDPKDIDYGQRCKYHIYRFKLNHYRLKVHRLQLRTKSPLYFLVIPAKAGEWSKVLLSKPNN